MERKGIQTEKGNVNRQISADNKLLVFLQGSGITSMEQLYEKISAMNDAYYDLRGESVKTERRLAALDERKEMWAQYEKYKPIRQKLDKVKPGKREKYQQDHLEALCLRRQETTGNLAHEFNVSTGTIRRDIVVLTCLKIGRLWTAFSLF